jgi:hypothetical protein
MHAYVWILVHMWTPHTEKRFDLESSRRFHVFKSLARLESASEIASLRYSKGQARFKDCDL